MTCPDCERHKLSASMWRNKAYEASGTPLPWNPEELLRKEYERGLADGMQERGHQEKYEELKQKYEQLAEAHSLNLRQSQSYVSMSASGAVLAFQERLADAIEELPFGDTAESFAIFVRDFK